MERRHWPCMLEIGMHFGGSAAERLLCQRLGKRAQTPRPGGLCRSSIGGCCSRKEAKKVGYVH